MDISIIIPTHNRHHCILALLNSLETQVIEPLQLEVLVISNLKDTKLESLLSTKKLSNGITISFHVAGSLGVNHARNFGILHSMSRHLLFLDDDVLLDNPDCLSLYYQHCLDHPEEAGIGGRYRLPPTFNKIDQAYFNICEKWLTSGLLDNQKTINLVGGNVLYNRSIIGTKLRFDGSMKFGGAETELNLRLIEADHSLMLFEDISVVHISNLTLLTFIKKAYFQGRGRAYHKSKFKEETFSLQSKSTESDWNLFELIYRIFFKTGYLVGLKKDHLKSFVKKLKLSSEENLRLRKVICNHPMVNWRDAFGHSQIESKRRIVEKLSSELAPDRNVLLIGGWVGMIPYLLNLKKVFTGKVINIEIDPEALAASADFNSLASFKYETLLMDATKVKYLDYENLIIVNTSCEHLSNYSEWIKLIPAGTRCYFQSNNMYGIEGHVNCHKTLEDFKNNSGLASIESTEEIDIGDGWLRYMLVGIK
jgi:glycosyltransferase involved in cell wall biosynthesis